LEVLFPLDFHQLISGDSVDDSRRRLDQVGAKPELFHFMVSILHSELDSCFSEPLGFEKLVLPSTHPCVSKGALNVGLSMASLTCNAPRTLLQVRWAQKGICCTVFDGNFCLFLIKIRI
jgi:hypothetical protein